MRTPFCDDDVAPYSGAEFNCGKCDRRLRPNDKYVPPELVEVTQFGGEPRFVLGDGPSRGWLTRSCAHCGFEWAEWPADDPGPGEQ